MGWRNFRWRFLARVLFQNDQSSNLYFITEESGHVPGRQRPGRQICRTFGSAETAAGEYFVLDRPSIYLCGSNSTRTVRVSSAGAGAYFHCLMAFIVDWPRIGLPPSSFVLLTAPLGETWTSTRTTPPM